METINIYGSIGYTLLYNKNYILILADDHSNLPHCQNYYKISDWLKNKSNKNYILLEEVPRGDFKLQELFLDSEHSQDLKQLFLNNSKSIFGLDPRPYLIPFSINFKNDYDFILKDYLCSFEEFFNFKNDFFKKELKEAYNKEYIKKSKLRIQFGFIKREYDTFKNDNKLLMNTNLKKIDDNILYKTNEVLDNIMEFYIICKIYSLSDKNIIIHAGLSHTDKVIFWLNKLYGYKIINQKGVNSIKEVINTKLKDGCISIPNIINKYF